MTRSAPICWLLVVPLLAALHGGCNLLEEATLEGVSCSSDTDCAPGERCDGGLCLAATSDVDGPDASDQTGGGNRLCGAAFCGAGLDCCGLGSCVDLQSDPTNCGACGAHCAAGESCVDGACTCGASSCGIGQTCCGTLCASLAIDTANCGACGNACGADELCVDGLCVCELAGGATQQCLETETCCPQRGCRDTTRDVRNCGACGNACGTGESCIEGVCRCGTGAGCTGADEICCGSPGQCVPSGDPLCDCGGAACAFGQTCCAGALEACADLLIDELNCGECGAICDPGEQCRSGACQCEGSLLDCDAQPGCEADIRSDTNHCGACNQPCGLPTPTCCGGACANRDSDLEHCGECGNACLERANATRTCVAGACGFSCEAGWGDCNTDPADGCEHFLQDSLTHCGSCGNACGPDQQCLAGVCRVSCPADTGNCDGNASNGCETDLKQDDQHCTACGNACPAGQRCRGGQCR